MSGLFGVPSGTGGGSVPWYQQPTYTGQGLIPSSALFGGMGSGAKPGSSGGPDGAGGGGGSFAPGQKQNQQKAEAPADEDFYCDSCEKEFSQESQYKAHIATHVSCLEPGCKFTGSQRVVKEHAQMAHGSGSGKKKGGDGGLADFGISLETPEEIARWREARAKNWPSNANIQRKKELESQRQSRGQPDAPQQKKGRHGGPAWKMKSSIQANGGGSNNAKQERIQGQGQGQNHEREEESRARGSHGNAAKGKQDADDAGARGAEEGMEKSDAAAAPAPASDIFGLGCYESEEEEEEEEDEGPPVAAATRQSAEDAAREQYLQEEKEQHERQQAAAQHGGRGHGGSKVSERGGGARGAGGSSSGRNAARGDGNSRKKGRGSDGYQSHGRIERRGGSLLGKLLSDDTHKQDAMLLQAIRHLALEFPPPV